MEFKKPYTFDNFCHQTNKWLKGTVDGRNPAPVEVGSLSHHLKGFIHPRWLADFFPSTVGWHWYDAPSFYVQKGQIFQLNHKKSLLHLLLSIESWLVNAEILISQFMSFHNPYIIWIGNVIPYIIQTNQGPFFHCSFLSLLSASELSEGVALIPWVGVNPGTGISLVLSFWGSKAPTDFC